MTQPRPAPARLAELEHRFSIRRGRQNLNQAGPEAGAPGHLLRLAQLSDGARALARFNVRLSRVAQLYESQ